MMSRLWRKRRGGAVVQKLLKRGGGVLQCWYDDTPFLLNGVSFIQAF